MILKNNKNKKGFVLLFVIVLSSIILSISLGLTDIAFKEVIFSTSTRASNDAFYAADTGVECALYWDLYSGVSAFGRDPGPSSITTICANVVIDIYSTNPNPYGTWEFYLHGLGINQNSCVKVVVDKPNAPPYGTTIIASGYDIGEAPDCSSSNKNRVERQLEVNY